MSCLAHALSSTRRCAVRALVALAAFSLSVAAATASTLEIVLADGHVEVLAEARIATLTRHEQVESAHGETHRFAGYALREVLQLAGVATDGLRGRAVATVLFAEAADGCSAAFALAELDPTIGSRQVLLADRVDDMPLPELMRPWRLVVGGERRPTRWVRNLVRIRVVESLR